MRSVLYVMHAVGGIYVHDVGAMRHPTKCTTYASIERRTMHMAEFKSWCGMLLTLGPLWCIGVKV